ncbi:MAG: glutathione S-transferase family protein [Alteromonadaceae bacterium]|nr:glutathione S-transferase family protein [Alteromonadaceae bacterium]
MKLYGSTTSPYVRRIRLYLALNNVSVNDQQFVNLDVFSETGRAQLIKDNPTLKVPYLVDDQQSVFDSRVIFRYLAQKFDQPTISWHEENLLTLIDAANDSFVTLFLLRRSGIDSKEDVLFFNLQNERVAILVEQLNVAITKGDFQQWHYPSICLFCLLDWANLRELYPFEKYEALMTFMENVKAKPELAEQLSETDPRN